MPMTGKTVPAAGLKTGDKVLCQLPAVSWTIRLVVSDGSDGGDVHVISTTNSGHYYEAGQRVKIRRDPAFCAHCSFGWRAGGTGPHQYGWCRKHPQKKGIAEHDS